MTKQLKIDLIAVRHLDARYRAFHHVGSNSANGLKLACG